MSRELFMGQDRQGNKMTIVYPDNAASSGPVPLDFTSLSPAGTAGSALTTGTAFVIFTVAGSCALKFMAEYRAATGEFANLRLRARSKSVAPVTCANFAASAQQNDYGNLYAVQGYAQPNAYTQASGDNIVSALYGCVQRTAASSGRTWVLWVDTHQQTKSDGGDYLARMSHNGTVANDGCFSIYNGGRMPFLFNFEDAAGFLTDSGSPGSTAAGYIAVKTPAGTKYIPLMTA